MKRTVIGALALSCALGAAALAQPGLIELPNAWKIVRPSGAVAATGTMPEGITLSQDAKRAFIVEGGWGPNGLRTVDLGTMQTTSFVEMKSAFGRALRDANGDGMWVAGGSTDAIAHISSGAIDRQIKLDAGSYVVDITRSPDGKLLAVVGESANKIAFIDEAAGTVIAQVDVGHHPRAALFSQDGATLYVSNWGQRTVDRIDVATKKNLGSIAVGMHPGAMVMDGTMLDVVVADDDMVASIDTKTNTVVKTGSVHGRGEIGWSPNNLRLVGDSLYVSCGAANAVVVLDAKTLALRTSVPSGWYPTDAVETADALYVLDGKGEGGHANPKYNTNNRAAGGYIAGNLVGSLRKLPIPGAGPTRRIASVMRAQEPGPIVNAHGPIKHIIYVIKENRTYDQIFGDIKGADGDPSLVMFGGNVTPNEHAIVERFGIFDNFMDNAHVSADGHNWSMAAFANDYLEKMWPPNYSNRRKGYDFEDGAEPSVPHAGYLWDLATRSHVTFRNYGEFVTEPAKKGGDYTTQMPNLAASTDAKFPTFDMAIKDVDRFAEWRREFAGYVAAKSLPQLEILRFPRDHTSGTRVGAVTPAGMVADNDRAMGLLVDAVSHSPYWRDTLIVALEDDAQNGADHVDEQRSTLYLASAYARTGVHHAHYSTASVLHTIELILGMPPMTPYDAAALPLDAAFTTTPNFKPFTALATRIDTEATNTKAAYRASDSAKLDLAHADAADPGIMNDILWHSAHPGATPPPYGVFR